ncbi:MAG: sigma 54-interacting transcriptional regulator, partial [Thermoguttaceae bacterium]
MDATSSIEPWARPAGRALIISTDAELVDSLQSILRSDHHCSADCATSYAEAATLLERELPETVFLDLRRAAALEDPTHLLQRMAERSEGQTPVVAITDSGYVCDWAAVADLIIKGQLQLPLNRAQLARLLEVELAQTLFDAAPGPSVPKVVRGKTVAFRTYTPEMADMLEHVAMMAEHDVTLLLVGETGTGKTTLAKL